ncbi:MAG TPA: AraC family transcriptional regulator [Pricia sp.]|nr:AraC family transcriptional regulator [Pricia sp.]
MKTLHLKTASPLTIIEQIGTLLDGELTTIEGETTLHLDNDLAIGSISCMNLKNGISYLGYDVRFHQDIQMVHESVEGCPIYFTYASEDGLQHSFDTDGLTRHIEKFQTSIVRSVKETDDVFHFSEGKSYKITMIIVATTCGKISRNEDIDSDTGLFRKIEGIFRSRQKEKDFAYLGSYNLMIAEKIKQLHAVSFNGVVRSLVKEAIVIMILALEIQQHSDDLNKVEFNIGSLNHREMEMVKDLSEFIQNYPEREYTIKSLSLRSGLSSAKLQEGFKVMHGLTVTHYIRHIRMLAAEHLIKTTDLNISEIVYSIGLSSRSYFSKIFKKKYNCSPKAYQEHQVTSALAV